MLRTTLLAGSLVVLASLPAAAQATPLQLAIIQNDSAPNERDIQLVVPADGYLLMLQTVDGDVRVMFPVKPGSSSELHAGEYDLARLHTKIPYANGRSRGEIVAVWSKTPIRTEDFVRYGHWATTSLNRQEFKRDATSATIDLATSLGGSSGMAASVEYGRGVTYQDTVQVSSYRGDGEPLEWKVYRNLVRIQSNCPVGTRDVSGSGEYCSAPSERPRSSPKRTADPEQVYVPPRPLQAPAATRSTPPPPPATRPATPPPAERRPSKQPL